MQDVTIQVGASSSSSSDEDERDSLVQVSRRESLMLFREVAEELAEESKAFMKENMTTDFEKAAQGEPFDLRAYFQNANAQALSQGGKPKRMGVSVKNLTVVGLAPETSVIATNATPFLFVANLFNPYYWMTKMPTTDILSDVDLFCKDGEMILVLGRPGSGCSTLLRILANIREGYEEVRGEVKFGGLPAEEFSQFRGEAVYAPEEDCHYPWLTLRETLDFVLKCKTPGNRLPEETRDKFREKMIKLLTTMFGLQKQMDTIVGNEFVRGLSGGERKRLTLMEAMVTGAAITSWDCGTRGLDAASAFDYTQCLRVMTDVLGKTTICSFYQASEAIYELFDRVLVLDKGKTIYFGPTKDAKQYFLDLGFECEPRKSTPDFLTGVTNSQERIIKKGFENTAPTTSFEFGKAWKNSKNYQDALEEQRKYDAEIESAQPAKEFIEEVHAQKARSTRKSSVYMAGFHTAVWALTLREFTLRWRDKFSLYSRLLSVLVQGCIYSSVFFLMPETDSGLYSRGGALYCTVLFITMLFMSEVPAVFVHRVILQKHKAYAMYSPSAHHLAQVMTDFPFVFAQSLMYSLISYFMYGLKSDGNNFFIYLFIVILASMYQLSFFRLLGNMMPSVYLSQQLQSVCIISMLLYTGFVIPYSKMHPWFQWWHWVNPISYTQKALMINEIRDSVYSCEDTAIPFGGNYTESDFRTCTINPAVPGQLYVDGNSYLNDYLNFATHHLPLDIFVIIFYWILWTVLNCLCVECLEFTGGGYTKKVYKAGKAPKSGSEEQEKAQALMVKEATQDMGKKLTMRSSTFSWRNLKYTVPVGGVEKKRQLLHDIAGWIKPGQMTALMGSSGAGKTTLLDVLAKRKTIGKIEGEILLNGKPLRIDFERITGYVEQMDVFNPALTVREALRYSAKLRQDPSIPLEEKYEYVEQVLAMMEMQQLGDALIGDLATGIGISVEERKRLTIGMELVAQPHILFLDEPTSGLDAQSSFNIIKFIRKLADSGMPLVCTIHQPSSVLFEYFDRILLLARGGKTVYFGDIGDNSKTLVKYFHSHGFRKCTNDENPAEYILEAIGAGVNGKSSTDWVEVWNNSPEFLEVQEELVRLQNSAAPEEKGEEPREFATNQFYQFWEVYKRMNLIWWRSPYYNTGRFFKGVFLGLILGFSYWMLEDSASDLRSRVFVLYQTMFMGVMLIFSSLPNFYVQREYFRRDYASKFYSWFPFASSIVLVEIPYVFVISSLCYVCLYWTAGLEFQSSIINGFYFWLALAFFTCYCVALGQAVASMCTHVLQALIVVPMMLVFFYLFCGVLNPPDSLPYFWRSWMYHLVPSRYYLEGIVTDILVDLKINCTEDDTKILPPPGTTCGEYMSDFLVNNTGYIINPNATQPEFCGYCQYQQGSDYFETFMGWSYNDHWRNLGIIVCYWFAAVLTAVVFTYINRKGAR
eukprot:TRINITY_DN345_c0_g2_i1.p1 TRINITY_DN345_c0_g2~~TRINITY_DN345_c0_g2_i1.p1  ORF type:complete len:1435 (+),score=320.94 TRINITY_DN345_c0_g2_i1:614-4918(+)